MPLDLFQNDRNDQMAFAGRSAATELPSTFSQNFDVAWNENQLFSQSIAGENSRMVALQDHLDEIRQKTGNDIGANIDYGIDAPGVGPIGGYPATDLLRQVNTEAEKIGAPTLSADDLEQRAIAKSRAARADYADINSREKTLGGKFGNLAGGGASAFTDPVNMLAFPLAPTAGAGIIGTALTWAGIAGGTQLTIEAIGSPYRETVQPGYGQSGEPAMNILGAAAFGGVLGGGIKGLGATWARLKTGQWPRTIRDAGNVVESEAQVINSNPYPGVEGEAAHRTALQQSIDDLVSGRPANVDNVITPSILQAYERRLTPVMDARAKAAGAQDAAAALDREGARLPPTVERLSEQQLLEIHQAATRLDTEAAALRQGLAGEQTAITAQRATQTEHAASIDGLRADVERLQTGAADARERITQARPVADPITEARLTQVQTDLAAPNLQSGRRAALEAEQASIVQTLEKTAPADRRLIASLTQEATGLERALAKAQRDLAKAEKTVAKNELTLSSREARLPSRTQNTEGRITSRRDTVTTEMRKAITALSNDGYGLRILREDAQAMAERVLAADNQGADAAIRNITETFVDRRLQARKAEPAPELPFGQTNAAAQKVAEKGYWTEEMRKGITALAREAGYVMPRDEAATIAAHLSGLSEHDALAVLDELILRPRTLAETLPGAGGAAEPIKIVGSPDGTGIVPLGKKVGIVNAYDGELAADLSPKQISEIRADPLTDEAVTLDLDRLRASKGDLQMPYGETVAPDGRKIAIMRSVDDVMAELDDRIAAANEIKLCATPEPGVNQ